MKVSIDATIEVNQDIAMDVVGFYAAFASFNGTYLHIIDKSPFPRTSCEHVLRLKTSNAIRRRLYNK